MRDDNTRNRAIQKTHGDIRDLSSIHCAGGAGERKMEMRKMTKHITKVSDEGRGTNLEWARVEHAGCYIVGNLHDSAGYYGAPKLYNVHINTHGGEYVIVEGKRVYITENQI